MSAKPFDSKAIKVGVVSAVVALPFAIALGGLAADWSLLVQSLFFGSKWFTWKTTVIVVVLLVFGIAAAISQHSRIIK